MQVVRSKITLQRAQGNAEQSRNIKSSRSKVLLNEQKKKLVKNGKNRNSRARVSHLNIVQVRSRNNIQKAKNNKGLIFDRFFTTPLVHPYQEIEWERRNSTILDEKGEVVFQLEDAEVPKNWSQLATDIVVSKYFRKAGIPKTGHESSVKEVILRIAKTIRASGEEQGYFATSEDAQTFEDELTYLLVSQRAAFNSPVWFNCGLYHQYGILGSGGNWFYNPKTGSIEETGDSYSHPQCSACFIQSVSDDLTSIFDLIKTESRIFKYGSGTGTNFSTLRSRGEKLSGGGASSGVMSFLEVFDKGAGSIKSGGITRRAAKMVILDVDHPEIIDFVNWKVKEEKKVQILISAGYDSDFNKEAYSTVSGQNSNNSVRITDKYMNAVLEDKEWSTVNRTDGSVAQTYKASDLFDQICLAAWQCADPGLQFDTTINKWHTCPANGKIRASNPCSEYMFLDDSACNLASINLLKFLKDDGTFDVESFLQAVRIFTTAMEIIVDLASYPTAKITQNSHEFRSLGLGYANLGALLMVLGVPYDSEEGRGVASAVTAILHNKAYVTSAEIASFVGPFLKFRENLEPMLKVIKQHRDATFRIDPKYTPQDLLSAAKKEADQMMVLGEKYGFRNAQVTNIAPTGTIGLLMDCDTTGIEPDFALVKFKKLAGGGFFKIVNQSVPASLLRLGYTPEQIRDIVRYAVGTQSLENDSPINKISLTQKGFDEADLLKIQKGLPAAFELSHVFNPKTVGISTLERLGLTKEQSDSPSFDLLGSLGFSRDEIGKANEIICGRMTLEGAPYLKDEHLKVFDCASKCGPSGKRFIEPMGHVKMMAAVQPFLSGSISKTVNLPSEATVDEIKEIYFQAWRLGLKSIALYRDGSKLSQPLSSKAKEKTGEIVKIVERPSRRRLPDERESITHKFSIGSTEGYITVGLYEDGKPGEVFITMAKQGSVISGLVDSFATSISVGLQYGVPLEVLVNKFAHSRFEPSGYTNHPKIRIAKSIVDYIFRWLGYKFLPQELWDQIGINGHQEEKKTEEGNQEKREEKSETSETSETVLTTEEARISSNIPIKFDTESDAPACTECGSIMVRNGSCYKCLNCGATSGCS
jgi:ribonucleoside-diphosphate reductase alpha chain